MENLLNSNIPKGRSMKKYAEEIREHSSKTIENHQCARARCTVESKNYSEVAFAHLQFWENASKCSKYILQWWLLNLYAMKISFSQKVFSLWSHARTWLESLSVLRHWINCVYSVALPPKRPQSTQSPIQYTAHKRLDIRSTGYKWFLADLA